MDAVKGLCTLLVGCVVMVVAVSGAAHSAQREEAVEQSDLVVFAGHPRLIVAGYRGPTIEDLQTTCRAAQMRGECERIGGRHILDNAMAYLLTGDAARASAVRQALMAGVRCGDGYEATPAGGYAIAYDWVWDSLTEADRQHIEANLAQCGKNIVTALHGNSAHLWHGFTSQAAALALIALAIDEHPERDVLRAEARQLFRQDALEAYETVGGAWPEGYNYERSHFFSGDPPYQYVIDALRAWNTAVERDSEGHASVYETIAAEEGDWLRGLALHVVYGTLSPAQDGGKLTLMRGGDLPTGQAYPNKQYRPFVDAIARAYDDGVLASWGRRLERDWPFVGGSGTYHPIHRYALPYTLPVGTSSAPLDRLPLGRIWSRRELGYVVSRSDWSDDGTVIAYRAGKWFTGHQHMDQGHIDVWRRGPLAVDAGVYAGWGSDHRESYYMRAVAHNTILVHRDGETFEGHRGAPEVNDDGQRIQTYNRRGCAQCMQSVAEWRENVGQGLHFEAGTIEAYESAEAPAGYTFVASDITSAYNSTRYSTPGVEPKIELAQRDLLFLRPSPLIVVDRVRTTAGSGRPRFVLHLPVRPEAAGLSVVEGSRDDGILVGAARTVTVTNEGGGEMRVSTLHPEASQITLIGGPNHRYWVDGANRVAGSSGKEGPPAEPGLWRMEVAPGLRESGGWLLVNVLDVTDAGVPASQVELMWLDVDAAAPMSALAVRFAARRGRRATVVMSGTVPRAALRYAELPGHGQLAGPLVLADLVPGETYTLGRDGDAVGKFTASPEGLATVALEFGTSASFGICPPPDGAGPAWRRLCGEGPPEQELVLLPMCVR